MYAMIHALHDADQHLCITYMYAMIHALYDADQHPCVNGLLKQIPKYESDCYVKLTHTVCSAFSDLRKVTVPVSRIYTGT